MEKYQKVFTERLIKTLHEWNDSHSISNTELYRFLHSLKGTASTIGLDTLSVLGEDLLGLMDESLESNWPHKEWVLFLQPITEYLSLTFEEEGGREVLPSLAQKQEENTKNVILFIVDDLETMDWIKEPLEKEGYEVLVATAISKAINLFYEYRPDCIMVDMNLQGDKIHSVIKKIVIKAIQRVVPVMLMGSTENREWKIKAYDLGLTDYLEKPFTTKELLAILKNRIKSKDLLTSRMMRDELTDAYNLKFYRDEMERQVAGFIRNGTTFSLAILDLDNFKNINDKFGHDTGDEVLKGLAKMILQSKRKNDYFIRYGGEEFILLMPHTDAATAYVIMNRHLENFSSIVFTANGQEFTCTFSSGVSEMKKGLATGDELFKEADSTLLHAKEKGKNQVGIYNQTIPSLPSKEKLIRIGIIDDDPIIQQLLLDHLKQLKLNNVNIEVKDFREGESFMESDWHSQGGKYILLLDGMMPRMDGLEVLQKIRKKYREEDFIVIMLTARKKDQDVVTALNIGADDYLTKPFSLAEIDARIKRYAARFSIGRK